MLVSVIIPSYQTPPELLRDSLESISGGVLPRNGELYEVLLVLDGPLGVDLEAVQQILDTFPDCTVLQHEKNKGLASARATGVAAASGRYVFFLDADDRVAPGGIRFLLDAALTSGVDIIDGVILAITNSGAVVHRSDQNRGIHDLRLRTLRAETSFMMQGSLYTRKLLTPVILNAGHRYPHEDAITRVNTLMSARSHSAVLFPTYFYMRRENTLTSSNTFERFLGFLHSFEVWQSSIAGVAGESDLRNAARHGGRNILFRLVCIAPMRAWKNYYVALKDFPGARALLSLSNSFSFYLGALRRLSRKILGRFFSRS